MLIMFHFIFVHMFRFAIRFRKHFTVNSICHHIIQRNRFIFIETMLKFEFLFARMMVFRAVNSVLTIRMTAFGGGIATGAERNLCLMLGRSEFPARRAQRKIDVHILLVARCRHTLR